MCDGLTDFSWSTFQRTQPHSVAEQDLCLRLEVLLVKMQDRNPEESAILRLVGQLNQLGHDLQSETVPGLDYFFHEVFDVSRVLEIRGVGEWFTVRMRSFEENST